MNEWSYTVIFYLFNSPSQFFLSKAELQGAEQQDAEQDAGKAISGSPSLISKSVLLLTGLK